MTLFSQARMIATLSPGEEKDFQRLLMLEVSMPPVKKITCLTEIFLFANADTIVQNYLSRLVLLDWTREPVICQEIKSEGLW